MRLEAELSGEAEELARAELASVAQDVGVRVLEELGPSGGRTVAIDARDIDQGRTLLARLSLTRRIVRDLGDGHRAEGWLRSEGRGGASASFRRRGHPTSGGSDALIHRYAQAWKTGGGSIDLGRPARRFWVDASVPGTGELYEEVGAVDRTAIRARRISRLPFRRPVGLDPCLARAAANLAPAGPGRRIVDPFVGTGALLAEAALLGAEVVGVDIDLEMIRGAARNLEAVAGRAAQLIGGDAGEVAEQFAHEEFDAVLTDAPYGRASGTAGEPVSELLARVLPLWAERVRPGGRVVLVTAGGPDPVPAPWRRTISVSVRQHRSLTREFRVYERERPSTGR